MAKSAGDIPLADWLTGLRAELRAAQEAAEDESLKFELGPIDLEFDVCTTREADGRAGLRFWVTEAGTGVRRSSARTQRVRMTLLPQEGTLVRYPEAEESL
ncbi:trypco2 family protein [Streptomyces sp. NPDC093544]|uniref:trypco2 family protein n=1 Tax=Streptomyces sp. NPDC093544 TaxID=3155200 RepID=UPI003415BC68